VTPSLLRLLAVGGAVAVAVQLSLAPLWASSASWPPVVAAASAHVVLVGLVTRLSLGRGHTARAADVVTIGRGMIATGVTSLLLAGLHGAPTLPSFALTAVAAIAVVLDVVDGVVARRTRSATVSGGRLDIEMDALVGLVVAGAVAALHGWGWIALGLVRYVWLVAQLAVPRLRAPLPPRRWRRETGVAQMVALVGASIPGVPSSVVGPALAVVGVAVVWSFVRDTSMLLTAEQGE
jgi:phosphatidylglycerophosphate synthase